MALGIETFSNLSGGNAFFKAIGHPLAAEKVRTLFARLEASGPLAIYDPLGLAEGFAALYPLSGLALAGVFVQKIEEVGARRLGTSAQPVTELAASSAKSLLIVAFDAGRLVEHVRALVPPGMALASLDEIKLPGELLASGRRYLDPLNFATNFVFFRDADGLHTRLVGANYWSGYGAGDVAIWLRLFDESGATLASWREALPPGLGSIVLDSRELRRRFALPPFTGQLFLHVIGAAGHDVVKYALDVYGEAKGDLSATHDANAWPADLYAGLPAPGEGERVVLWLQNSHPAPIPAGAVGLNLMGSAEIARLEREIAPFATHALDVASLLPEARWPQQLEVQAGKHFVRPRYEIAGKSGKRRIAHVNVERSDLSCDPRIAELGNLMGKGFLLPAPLLPPKEYRTTVLPTPMATCQDDLPIALLVYDADGSACARHRFGRLPRRDSVALELAELVDGGEGLAGGYGHLELVYDFSDGGSADGWLHGIFRYEDKTSGHAAETSFGAHIFNTVLTYRSEPQSYAGPPPGLSTRLFLRLGEAPFDTLCHLIYPASASWHLHSATELILCDRSGAKVAEKRLEIPCGGSRLWRYSATFDAAERKAAGGSAYVVVRDRSCRLFGYHGLLGPERSFSLDHMFGF